MNPRPLPDPQWIAFVSNPLPIPTKERAAAFYYELARISPDVRKLVDRWRQAVAQACPRYSGDQRVLLAGNLNARCGLAGYSVPRVHLMDTGPEQWYYPQLWAIPPSLPAMFPEFPDTPWLQLPSSGAKDYWIDELRSYQPLANVPKAKRREKEPLFEFAPAVMVSPRDHREGMLEAAIDIFKDYVLDDARRTPGMSYLALRWHWSEYTDGELLQMVKKFLTEERPPGKLVKPRSERRTKFGQLPFDFATGFRAISLWLRYEEVKRQAGSSMAPNEVVRWLSGLYADRDPWMRKSKNVRYLDRMIMRDIDFARKLVNWAGKYDPDDCPEPPTQR